MKYIFIILIIIGCRKNEFGRSFYLHGGGTKEWEQVLSIKIEDGKYSMSRILAIHYIFHSDNTLIITNGSKGIWILDGDKLTIVVNGNSITLTVILLKSNRLATESYLGSITYNNIWEPI